MRPPPGRTGSAGGVFSLAARARSFGHALRGIGTLVTSQPNARIHAAATACVALTALVARVSVGEWVALALAVGLVWAAEALNTAVELLADAVHPGEHPLVGRAKDVAAAGVLLASLAAAVVGVLVLGPPLWRGLVGAE